MSALVEQASAGIGRTGAEAAEGLAGNLDRASAAIEGLSSQVAEQERSSQRMLGEIDRGLALIDERFTELATNGDERANHFLRSPSRARSELDQLGVDAGTQEMAIGAILERTAALRYSIDRLADDVREGIGTALGEAQGSADRLIASAAAARPDISWVRDAAVEASERIDGTTSHISDQQERFAALLGSLDLGVSGAQARIAELTAAIAGAQVDAEAERGYGADAGHGAGAGQGGRASRRRPRPRGDRRDPPGKRRQAVERTSGSARDRHPREHRGAPSRGRECSGRGRRIPRALRLTA